MEKPWERGLQIYSTFSAPFYNVSSSFSFTAFSYVMKGVEGYQNEGYTIMTLMRMTFGEFDVSFS